MVAIRPPAVAGRFYPGTRDSCQRVAAELFRGVQALPAVGGVVPHAGWVYSGATAALSIAGLAAASPDTIVIFGAVHGADSNAASVSSAGSWATPLGELHIDEDLARRFVRDRRIVDNPSPHRYEHAIEVQVPLIQHLLPNVKIVPVGVRPSLEASEIGRFCASQVAEIGRKIAFLGSTDLTHYGPAFGFEPHGRGAAGVHWAKEVNDRRLITLIETLNSDAVVPEALANHNACGPGAVAATIGAMLELGVDRYVELRHTCSAETGDVDDRDPYNSVGYEAGVFVKAV
jgi:MEMO1 family protein